MKRSERSVLAVPWRIRALLIAAFALQIYWGASRPAPTISVGELPLPPSPAAMRVLALGEPELLARLAMLWLQGFDYQPGVSIALADLDYARVETWLERALDLDPSFQYPLLAAARIYGEAGSRAEQYRMLEFIARRFPEDPVGRWQWMAHAVYIAKHRLNDPALALSLARELAQAPAHASIPSWARQMHIFVLEDMGEVESAKVLLGGLLESGEITDEHEQWFLAQRLHDLERRSAAPTTD